MIHILLTCMCMCMCPSVEKLQVCFSDHAVFKLLVSSLRVPLHQLLKTVANIFLLPLILREWRIPFIHLLRHAWTFSLPQCNQTSHYMKTGVQALTSLWFFIYVWRQNLIVTKPGHLPAYIKIIVIFFAGSDHLWTTRELTKIGHYLFQ